MKTKILLLLTSSFVFCYVQAQTVKFGIKGGANMNKLSGQSFEEGFSFGYHLGGFLDIGLSEKWGLQPEVLFSQVNYDTTSKFRDIFNADINKVSNIKLSYLNIPILLEYKLSKKIALQAGPQFGIIIDQNKDLLANGEDAFTKGEFGLLGGLQLKFNSIVIYGRYGLGLNDLNDTDKPDKWKSQTIQIGLGLTLL